MSHGRPYETNESVLCEQCHFLFSTKGFNQLTSTGKFRHSQLGTFANRLGCRFCCYLWNDDLLGASSQVYKIRRLRDLLSPASGNSRKHEELRQCWVVITRPVMKNYIMGLNGNVVSLEPYTLARELVNEKAVDRFFVGVETEKGQLKWQGFSPLRLSVPKSSPLAKYTNFRQVTWDGLTDQWAMDIKTMLQWCTTSHPQCQQTRPRVLPTRLLHIRGDSAANLHVQLIATPKGQLLEYAALSYCWGGPQLLQLTKNTVQSLLQQPIESRNLPQGLIDAVQVVSSLGLEYLWVDALCIVQDDPDDKKTEIGRMGAIYQNSFVTIAAATSSSVNDSFLSNTLPLNTKYSTCDVPFTQNANQTNSSDAPSSITVSPIHAHRSDIFPLNKRGWAFQEALLPTRLLVFGDLEPFVRCRTKNVIQKSASCIDYAMTAVHPRRMIDSLANSQAHESGLFTDTKASNLDSLWREIVEQYTLRELSITEDRLLAIGGVVDLLAETFGDECCFGVWMSCAVECLLWKTEVFEGRTVLLDVPTWSWMSVTGPVDLESMVYFDRAESSVEWDETDESHSRLLVTCCVLKAESVYGLTHDDGQEVLVEGWPDVIPSSATSTRQPTFETVEECAFLVLGRSTHGRYFAIIATHEEGGVYHRCGLAELNLTDTWRTQPKQQVVIV
ncbi:HET-domain-containing protein [Astrocystis sublimbata]|nr:HET-domain-containing protein [Astrocystis sublimbata]